MTHLILGATGQVGQALMATLRARGETVVGTGLTHAADITVDLGEPAAVRAVLTRVAPDVVWVVGAFTHVDACEADPVRSRRVNRDGPAAVAAWATVRTVPVLFFSTDYVFDGSHGPYAEEDAPRPLSVYGRDKRAAEEAVLATPGGLVLRTAWVYSWEADPKNFCQRLALNLARGERATVPADQWGNPTYAPDLAEAAIALWQRATTGIVHVAGPAVMTRYDFACQIAEAFDLDPGLIEAVPTAALAQRAPRPLHGGLRVERLARLLGTVPRPPGAVLPLLKASFAAQRERHPD
jgi:dTDP-4-dehydrorhamnose reductase